MLKIVITDYPKVLQRDISYEIELFKKNLPNVEVLVTEYTDKEAWIRKVQDADALIFALSRGIKHYEHQIDENRKWDYNSLSGLRRISGQTLGICGYGKIGRMVAEKARALGMKVIAWSPHLTCARAEREEIEVVDKEALFKRSDIITNHMAQSIENYHFFDQSAFEKMERAPLFINVGRGEAVDEAALVNALDKGLIRGAGLDVLESENPDLEKNPLRNRENVILTPHAAFYSQDSMRALQVISCMNLIYFLKGEYEAVQWLVNEKQLSFLHTKKP